LAAKKYGGSDFLSFIDNDKKKCSICPGNYEIIFAKNAIWYYMRYCSILNLQKIR